MNKYLVFNETDGVYASSEWFDTQVDAEQFIKNFPLRFKGQSYYLTSNRERISPEDVELIIQKISGDEF